MEDLEGLAWRNCDPDDLWIFDKLIVSRKLGYNCGPVGTDVPSPGNYIVRPCCNIPGMGRGAKIVSIDKDTYNHPECLPGHFWCELFQGRHISVDYHRGLPILSVEGFRENPNDPFYRFSKWEKVEHDWYMPTVFFPLTKKYEYINIEFIGGKVIEVHLRHNPDFSYGNDVMIPVWEDQEVNVPSGFRFIEGSDYLRKGMYVK